MILTEYEAMPNVLFKDTEATLLTFYRVMSVDNSSKIMITPVFILLISAALTCQASTQKVLVLLDDPLIRSTHSLYFSDLTSRGYDIFFKSASDRKLQLKDWDEWLYEKLIIFAPSATGERTLHHGISRWLHRRFDGRDGPTGRASFASFYSCLQQSTHLNS